MQRYFFHFVVNTLVPWRGVEWDELVLLSCRDVVLEASASARGGLEAVFQLARPRLGLTRSCIGLEGSALPRLGSNQST